MKFVQFHDKKFILSPRGKAFTIGEYVKNWKVLKALKTNPSFHVPTVCTNWSLSTKTPCEILQDIQKGLDDRINQRGGLIVKSDYHSAINLGNDKRLLQDNFEKRIMIFQYNSKTLRKIVNYKGDNPLRKARKWHFLNKLASN